jgi:3-hydroxybutyryl-CoA dehydratase
MIEPLRVGDRAELEHRFSAADVIEYIRISGDDNPIHRDADAARAAGFEHEVVHGLLVCSLVSQLLGTQVPGPGTILLGANLTFVRPVHVDQPVRVTVEVVKVREDKPIVTLAVRADTDAEVLRGEVVVKAPEPRWAAPGNGAPRA